MISQGGCYGSSLLFFLVVSRPTRFRGRGQTAIFSGVEQNCSLGTVNVLRVRCCRSVAQSARPPRRDLKRRTDAFLGHHVEVKVVKNIIITITAHVGCYLRAHLTSNQSHLLCRLGATCGRAGVSMGNGGRAMMVMLPAGAYHRA